MDAKKPDKRTKGDGPILLLLFAIMLAISAWLSTIPGVMWLFR